jgi:transposase
MRDRSRCDRCNSAPVRSQFGPYWTRDWTIDHLVLWTALTAEGLPVVCLGARHAKKALDMRVNKTDANDAEGLAHLVRAGWYREVRVKGRSAMLAKALLGARSQLLSMSLALENQIRGILKTFGRIVPKGGGGLFEKNVRVLITEDAAIAAVIMPLLQARQWRAVTVPRLTVVSSGWCRAMRPVACS